MPGSSAVTVKITLTVFCRQVRAAEKAFDSLINAGIAPEDVSVLAHGLDVDRILIITPERNANQLAGETAGVAEPSALARRLSAGRRLLLEGCWAAGPILFARIPPPEAARGEVVLAQALVRAGLDEAEAADLEATLREQGGVWLAAKCDRARAAAAARALKRVTGAKVKRLPQR